MISLEQGEGLVFIPNDFKHNLHQLGWINSDDNDNGDDDDDDDDDDDVSDYDNDYDMLTSSERILNRVITRGS